MDNILDYASTLDYLKMDLGLLPAPNDSWVVLAPVEEGVYYAGEDRYVFRGGELMKEEADG